MSSTSHEINEMISSKIEPAIETFKDGAEGVWKESAKTISKSVRDNPWIYIGGVAMVGALLGYYLGRKN